jgi:hypothetical protein
MPSTSPGRYQSRLFSFVNRHYRRLTDRGDRAIRHAQVATIWGVQVLLYPVYLLVQSAQLAGKRLQQAVQRLTGPQLPILPPADAPIQRVLELAQSYSAPAEEPPRPRPLSFLLGGKKSKQEQSVVSDSPDSPPITGIATLPETRNLVLVNHENEILDVLTSEQQQELDQHISFEVAHYWHQRHQLEEIQGSSNIVLAPPEESANLFLPVRFFRRLMSWVQTGPIATVVNLFQEDKQLVEWEDKRQQLKLRSQELKLRQQELELKKAHSLTPATPEETGTEESAFISSIDRAIAKLESGNLESVSRVTESVVHRSQEFLQQLKNRLSPQSIQSESTADELENPRRDDLKIQNLLQAAVDHFLGALPPNPLSWKETPAMGISEQEEDPWLTSNDLFGDATPSGKIERNSSPPLSPLGGKKKVTASGSLPPAKHARVENGNGIEKFIKRHLKPKQELVRRPKPQSDLAVRRKPTTAVTQSRKTSSEIAAAKSETKKARSLNTPTTGNSTTEWVETNAKPVGYVKHPLEQILDWLDRGMLWLEDLILRVWNWFENLMKGSK